MANAHAQITNYWSIVGKLSKIRVVAMMLFTASVGMLMTPIQYWDLTQALAGLLGIGLCSCAGGIINQVIERDIDASMARTARRPLIDGSISMTQAILLASLLIALSAFTLGLLTNTLTLWLTIGTMIGYSWVYTSLLKPNTSQNIVIGGLFGATPPLLGWTSLTGSIHLEPIVLVLIIFAWTPPHFWSLAIARKEDYDKTSLLMLPSTHGIAYTQLSILAYTVLLIIITQLPYLLTISSYMYAIGINGLNIMLIQRMIQVYYSGKPNCCLQAFRFSNIYLLSVFSLLLLDRLVY